MSSLKGDESELNYKLKKAMEYNSLLLKLNELNLYAITTTASQITALRNENKALRKMLEEVVNGANDFVHLMKQEV